MRELAPAHFPIVLPLYRMTERCYPLISAVIQGQQAGQIFVDDAESPGSALVITKFGFMQYIGKTDNSGFDDSIATAFQTPGIIRPSYILWYDPPGGWQVRLSSQSNEQVKVRERIRYEFQPQRADYLSSPVVQPDGYELKDLDNPLLVKAEKFKLDICNRFWTTCEEVMEKALGTCLIKGADIVSFCYAACVIDGLAEVDIVTDPDYRGQGLATATAKQFVKKCIKVGTVPTWDCFSYNKSSCLLAEKIGFARQYNYLFYSFNLQQGISSL